MTIGYTPAVENVRTHGVHPIAKYVMVRPDLTYAALARKVGVSPQFLCDIVKGRARPGLETLQKIILATDGSVTLDDLLTWETCAE